ncbi:MAG TPA: hypothetical protein VHR72_11035 [Gemmataceae bacterium]|jgi:hypothetical protein|nr:hypothetical protein [Gemmataceae bacterium]
MPSLIIIGICILAAIVYGVVHDQITARVCVEYFTIGHPPVFGTDDPTLLGLGWGVIATWWVGLILGVGLAIAARAGSRPKRSVSSLVRPVLTLMAVMALCAITAGFAGWLLAVNRMISLVPWLADRIPPERHARFIADGGAHDASYLVGLVGGIVVMVRVWLSRR